MPFIIIALILAAVIGGGTSIAAQSALPGDALWGFKVVINERLQPGNDIAAIQTRLQEAKELSEQGKLNAKERADILSNIDEHAAAVEKQINNSRSIGDYTTAAALATNLQAALAGAAGVLDVRTMLDVASGLSAEANAKLKQ